MKSLNRKKTIVLWFLLVGLAVFGSFVAAVAQEEVNGVNIVEDSNLEVKLQMLGTIEGTGTYFEVTDSNYLNITLESSKPVHLMLESVPKMIVMEFQAAEGAASTQITLRGFLPSTTYYKYEDDYHNGVTFTTDANGSYTYAQGLSESHLVFIQPWPSTKFIPSDTSIGTWDPGTRTYTLTTDVYETIQIDEDDLTLNGDGYMVTGAGAGYGVYLYGRTAVTVRNINVEGFSYGIHLYNSNGNSLEGNASRWNKSYGIYLYNSSGNTLTGNIASNNHEGIFLRNSSSNTLMANTTSNNYSGIFLYNSSSSTLTDNAASNNHLGIYLYYNCNNNTLTGNTANLNNSYGIYLYNSSGNTLTGNASHWNKSHGIYLYYNCNNNTFTGNIALNNYYGIYLYYNCNNNEIYNNNFIDNQTQAYVYYSSGNVFNLPEPVGGNYWSDWTAPDADRDGFVDNHYVFTAEQDNLPWTRQDGWFNQPPVADAGIDQMAHPVEVVTLDGSGSSDPEEDYPLAYSWQIISKPDGSTAVLSGPNIVNPSFTVDMLGDYIIELVVTDSLGAHSIADEVLISTFNESPVADAGIDQLVHPIEVVTLDGSGSSDPESDYPLTYFWQITSKPEGSTAVLSKPDIVNPSFTVDMLGDYIIELVVTDSFGAYSAADEVLISTFNTSPVANAGPNQTIIELGTTVELDGNWSSDAEGDEITYLWTITQKPAESTAELSDPCSATPTFVADIHGDYVITLVVTDIFGAVSDTDSVAVSFENIKPVADAGESRSVIVGDTVSLDGSGSTDGNGDLLTYSWSFTSVPAGSLADIADPALVQTSFVADEPGSYVISFVVNDGFVDSDAVNVTITAITAQEAVVLVLLNTIEVVSNLDPEILKNGNVTSDSLINKINAVLGIIGQENYRTALGKLENDILERTNGCADIGGPDSSDWILTCEGQSQVYPLIMEAVRILQKLI